MILLARVRAAPRLGSHRERTPPPREPRGLTVRRGGGLLVVTLETIRGRAGTRRQWQQHTLDFVRMIALLSGNLECSTPVFQSTFHTL
jgi:hypothetical protein